jgi:hypothetical protein
MKEQPVTKKTKASRIRQYLADHPDATARQVAEALKLSATLVHHTKYVLRKEAAGELPAVKPKPEPATTNISAVLQVRGVRYGDFRGHARVTQSIKHAFADSPNWTLLPDDMREALEMVAHKAGRILNGDPHYVDSWTDIAGYAKLIVDRLEAGASE